MRDKSIFQGWKEIGDFRIENNGATWRVFERRGTAFVHVGTIRRRMGESNKSLHDQCVEMVCDD